MFKIVRCIAALTAGAIMLTTGCASERGVEEKPSDALTWGTWSSYERYEPFVELLNETYPEVELDFISYRGANATGYSWLQMQADDISDIFITSQVLDEDLAKERLLDLSNYDFISSLSNSVLDQSSIDGGIYLIPVSYTMFGIYYNKTLMEEKGWEIPQNFAELEALCKEIEAEGLIPGMAGSVLTGSPFSAFFNLAKTDWLTTPEGIQWEKDFLAGRASAKDKWGPTMEYAKKYMDIGMFTVDADEENHPQLLKDYLGERRAVFFTASYAHSLTTVTADSTDEIGMMPFIGEDGSKNIYMYSPSFYFGISKRLAEPGNEKKLENALKIMSLLFSPEGQSVFLSENAPTTIGVLDNSDVPEDSMIYDAQQALRDGRAFKMTYVSWEHILADIGQAYKDWLFGKEGCDGDWCMERMDELVRENLTDSELLYFCTSTDDFTLEQTAVLLGKALGSSVGADAAMIPVGAFHDGVECSSGASGKLYKGEIDSDVSTSICPRFVGKYAVMEMTGAQAKALAAAGFDENGNGVPYDYILVTRGGAELEDDRTYSVAFLMNGYTEQTAETYSADVRDGSVRDFVREYLTEQKTVSPDGNPWE